MNQTKKISGSIITMLVFLFIGGICFIIKSFNPETMDANGFISDPYFFLTPIGFLFIGLAIVTGLIALVIKIIKLALQ